LPKVETKLADVTGGYYALKLYNFRKIRMIHLVGSLDFVETRPGFSTTFELLLVLSAAQSRPASVTAPPRSTEVHKPSAAPSLWVLLVEDIKVNRTVAVGLSIPIVD